MFNFFFFFNDTATTEIYTLSLHDALPISVPPTECPACKATLLPGAIACMDCGYLLQRSEEHTSELQSHVNLVCRLLLEKKNHDHDAIYMIKFLLYPIVTVDFERIASATGP